MENTYCYQAKCVDVCCWLMNSDPSWVRSVMHANKAPNSRSTTCLAW